VPASGFLRAFSTKPAHPVGEDGRMAISDHLRELRGRVLRAVLVISLAIVGCLFFFEQLLDLVMGPYRHAQEILGEDTTIASTSGVSGGLMVSLKLCGLAGVILTSPYWLYQLWAFILPGLHDNERKWSRVFVAIAGPLFMLGVLIGYVTLPKGLEVLIGFTPTDTINITDFGDYLSFFIRTLLVFGISFEIPVFIVLLNAAGLVKGRTLAAYRPWIVVGTFVFAAVATPSADPFTMTLLALPMCLLFFVSEVIARTVDKRRERAVLAGPSPDEASVL